MFATELGTTTIIFFLGLCGLMSLLMTRGRAPRRNGW